ncbi:MAG: hypothetical protein LBK60_10260 [Verrucomicrobiales bacterium]|jgi:hypothetical protein|nr:hypothetical protein [Verrucomicrobiales bacterium]
MDSINIYFSSVGEGYSQRPRREEELQIEYFHHQRLRHGLPLIPPKALIVKIINLQ